MKVKVKKARRAEKKNLSSFGSFLEELVLIYIRKDLSEETWKKSSWSGVK